MKNIRIFVLLLVIGSMNLLAQDPNPEVLIKKVRDNFIKVKDYEVDAHIKINVDFIKVPEADAKIYFKQPNKVKLASKQFAMLPKEGLNFSPNSFFNYKHSAVFIRTEDYSGFNTAVIKIIPLEDSTDIVLSTVWIDMNYNIIRKAEITTKYKGTYSLLLNYDVGKTKFFVPVELYFLFDVKTDNMPKEFSAKPQNEKARKKKAVKGNAVVTYTNYKINKGLPDSIFKEDKPIK